MQLYILVPFLSRFLILNIFFNFYSWKINLQEKGMFIPIIDLDNLLWLARKPQFVFLSLVVLILQLLISNVIGWVQPSSWLETSMLIERDNYFKLFIILIGLFFYARLYLLYHFLTGSCVLGCTMESIFPKSSCMGNDIHTFLWKLGSLHLSILASYLF